MERRVLSSVLSAALVAAMLTAGDAVRAAVYRCERAGRALFTDTPCAAGTQALDLQRPTTVAPTPGTDLGRDYDQRRERERKAQSAADQAWLRQHQIEQADEARIRRGLAEKRVVPGMNAQQLRQVWGEPSEIRPATNGGRERWIYHQGRGPRAQRRSVDLVDGIVAGHLSSAGSAGPSAAGP